MSFFTSAFRAAYLCLLVCRACSQDSMGEKGSKMPSMSRQASPRKEKLIKPSVRAGDKGEIGQVEYAFLRFSHLLWPS